MKSKILKILLVIFIIVHATAPLFTLGIYGYPDVPALLLDIYKNGVVVVLSAAIIMLINSKDK